MSRSYKHTPYAGEKKSKFFKNYSNRMIRRKTKINPYEVPQYSSFKKIMCSYDICDYYWIEPSFTNYYEKHNHDYYFWGVVIPAISKEEAYKEYQKMYIRK